MTRHTADTITDDALDNLHAERDSVYRERAHLLAWLASLYSRAAVITDAQDVDEPGWSLLFLTVEGRQLSWHIAPRDAELFAGVERVPSDDPRAKWDGHTTGEKYRRIAELAADEEQPVRQGDEDCAAPLSPARDAEAEGALAEVLGIVSAWCCEANDGGGVDAGDLAWRLEHAGYPLPDEETAGAAAEGIDH